MTAGNNYGKLFMSYFQSRICLISIQIFSSFCYKEAVNVSTLVKQSWCSKFGISVYQREALWVRTDV